MATIIIGDIMQMVKNIPNAWGKVLKIGFKIALLSVIRG